MFLFALRALWKGLKRNSLIFSLVFAMAVMGFSLAGLLRNPLRGFGLWWPLILILPFLVIGQAAKFEQRLRVRPSVRRFCVLLLLGGSLLLSVLFWRYEAALEARYADSFKPGPKFEEPKREVTLPRGPRHRR